MNTVVIRWKINVSLQRTPGVLDNTELLFYYAAGVLDRSEYDLIISAAIFFVTYTPQKYRLTSNVSIQNEAIPNSLPS